VSSLGRISSPGAAYAQRITGLAERVFERQLVQSDGEPNDVALLWFVCPAPTGDPWRPTKRYQHLWNTGPMHPRRLAAMMLYD
jgi:hypothetical protein